MIMPKTRRVMVKQSPTAAPSIQPRVATLQDVPIQLIDRYLGPRSLANLGATDRALHAQVHHWLTRPVAQRQQAQQRRLAQAVAQALGSVEIDELPDDVLHRWLDEEVTLGQSQHLQRAAAHAAQQGNDLLFAKVLDKVFGFYAAILELRALRKEGGANRLHFDATDLVDQIAIMQRLVTMANEAKFWAFRLEGAAADASWEAYRACCAKLPTLAPAQESALLDTIEAVCGDVPKNDIKQQVGETILEFLVDETEVGRLVRMLEKLITNGPAMPALLHKLLGDALCELAKRPGGASSIAGHLGSLAKHPNLYTDEDPADPACCIPEQESILVHRLLITDAVWEALSMDDSLSYLQAIWRQIGMRAGTNSSRCTAYWLGVRAQQICSGIPALSDPMIHRLVTTPEANETPQQQYLRNEVLRASRLTERLPVG